MKIIITLIFMLISSTSFGQNGQRNSGNIIQDNWNAGDPYEYFMGRWSSLMSVEFLSWLDSTASDVWLDLGCGTGALSESIVNRRSVGHLICVDPSKEYLIKAEQRVGKGTYLVGSGSNIPVGDHTVDILVSGLVLNFIPDIDSALTEIKRVLKDGGILAAYLWDYSGKMEMLRYFWDAAVRENQDARQLDEGIRFPICNPDSLKKLFEDAGFLQIEVTTLDIETRFVDFDDYWKPFLGGQGPAPGYLSSLSNEDQEKLRIRVYNSLPIEANGSIRLTGRAIAIKGIAEQKAVARDQ